MFRKQNRIVCGANSYGQLSIGNTEDSVVPVRSSNVEGEIKQVTGGGGHTAIVTEEGKLYLCGNNNKGQLGLDSAVNLHLQCLHLPSAISKVACGWEHTLAITASGDLIAWGSNSHGQAGQEVVSSSLPIKLKGFNGQPVCDIAAGLRHSLAVTIDGLVWSWGCGKKGQLGWMEAKKGLTYSHQPQQVPGCQKAHLVAAGAYHSIMLTVDGELFCWGDNKRGQMAIEPCKDKGTFVLDRPRQLDLRPLESGHRIIAVASGWTHVLILTDGGDIYSWGRNDYGQLGRSSVCHNPDGSPRGDICWQIVKIVQLNNIKQIACGSEHNLAVTEDGVICSWGWNEHGMCGDGTTQDIPEPKTVPALTGVRGHLIGSGAGHSVVVCR
ncbi:Secretion-regulating guanine nucleotide exchange factor [Holothuria leucospilota]|uniref:Secretion-regulating guanine nucleotide exchange factor n=1 Tax=Holothuria leucospilota TaxID=206669 RepID=A0A9Q1BG22_HOLLE|nr:Secretion-regulating guanine nucleotide exchange factor [Holothuria leucospilota]